jgi:hypothetical protein
VKITPKYFLKAVNEMLRNQAELFANLNCLRPAFGAQLVEQPAGVGLDGVFTYEQVLRDFAIAQALGDQLQYLEFAPRYPQLTKFRFV